MAFSRTNQLKMVKTARFATEYAISLKEIRKLRKLADVLADQQTKENNGDPHPFVANSDKEENSRMWGLDVNNTLKALTDLAQHLGFTGLDFPGLYPTLTKGETRFIEIPE
jgi:hypothetical protein